MHLTLRKLFVLPMLLALAGALTAHAQTSVSVSALGAFSTSTSNSDVHQNPSKQAGFMVELRHISNPLVGYDVSYSFRRANQGYVYTGPPVVNNCPGVGCPITSTINPQSVHADAQELTLNWVVSMHFLDFRPFALAGGGFQKFDPTGSQTGGTQGQTKAVFDYGAGVDWTVLPHLGLRFQYRGNVYKAPQLATAFSSTGKFTQDAEPMIGAYFNF